MHTQFPCNFSRSSRKHIWDCFYKNISRVLLFFYLDLLYNLTTWYFQWYSLCPKKTVVLWTNLDNAICSLIWRCLWWFCLSWYLLAHSQSFRDDHKVGYVRARSYRWVYVYEWVSTVFQKKSNVTICVILSFTSHIVRWMHIRWKPDKCWEFQSSFRSVLWSLDFLLKNLAYIYSCVPSFKKLLAIEIRFIWVYSASIRNC